MYIHIGNNRHIKSETLIGIFDIDTTTVDKHTRKFLNYAEKENLIETTTSELPRSFVVTTDKDKKWREQKIYLTQISTNALKGRANYSTNTSIIENE